MEPGWVQQASQNRQTVKVVIKNQMGIDIS